MNRLFRWMAAALLTAPGVALAEPAVADANLPPGWLETQVDQRGRHCSLQGQHPRGAGLLLACGAAGVWEVALTQDGPSLLRSHVLEGEAIGFFAEPDGSVWVKLRVLEARPLSAVLDEATTPQEPSGPSELPAPAAPPAQAPVGEEQEEEEEEDDVEEAHAAEQADAKRRVGRVLRAQAGEVVISLGQADGIARGDHIELSTAQGDTSEESELSRTILAVGLVTHVSDKVAKVRLGLNESVPVGAWASRSLAAPSASLTAPPRVGSIWSVEAAVRPFVALGELGGGMLLSASVSRRFASRFELRALLDPLGFVSVQDGGSTGVASGAVLAAYDSHFFEVGIGLGAQTVNETAFTLEPGSGLTVAQLLRLGAEDGLNLTARTSVVLFHSEFDFGGMVASMQIPVSRGYWLLLAGGGGNVGYGYGEFAVRALLSGNGAAGSTFLVVSGGGAAIFRSQTCDEFFNCSGSASNGGPMAGVGGQWRF